ncbi:MAG TPA: class I SAM-dependent methyltransferase [Kiritimatiellia bacterium]
MPDSEPRGITFQPDIYPAVLASLPPPPARILDVGAGEGYFAKLLKERGYQVEACDYLQDLFKVKEVPFHKSDLNQAIPLPDNSYDAVVSIEVLEHLENHVRFMQEVVRVTKPGGLIVLTTPNVLSLPSRWHFFLYGYTDCAPRPLDPRLKEYYMQHINPISVPEILFLLERFGAEMVDLKANRIRRGAVVPWLFLYPIFAIFLRGKLLRSKYRDMHDVYRRHIKWVLHPANLLGRITIAVGRKKANDQ